MDHSMCRLCYVNMADISLFDTGENGIKLYTRVTYCAKVMISEGDGLPARICMSCNQALESTYRFIIKCEETDKKLRDYDFDIKHNCELLVDVKLEEFDESLNLENKSDESVDDNNVENNLDTEIQNKCKYVKRSNVKRKSSGKLVSKKCKVCGRLCKSASTLLIHMRSHTNEKPHACVSCDKKYKDSGSLKRHVERNHVDVRERRFICEKCGKRFFSKNDCKIHVRIHTGELPYKCTECPARFTQIGAMQRHQVKHTGVKSHLCSVCSKRFYTKEQLKKHYVVHSTEKKFQCPICEAPFKYSNNLQKHIKMHTENVHNKFICNYCNRSYALKGNLQLHIQKQHSLKSGYCKECDKYVSNLETHMWKHTGERPIKCELCSSTFFDLKGLSTHVNFRHKHTERYKCTINECTFKFPSRPMLNYHIMRFHECIKPFACDKCTRMFYRKSDLARHKIGGHKEKLL